MLRSFLLFIIPFLVWISPSPASPSLRLPAIFGDNMVLQRDHAIPLWGWSTPGETLTVKLHSQVRMATADKNGLWKLVFLPEKAGGPYDVIFTGRTSKTLHNVLIGDVWFCSGQSNMEFALKDSRNAADEIKDSENPLIRQCKVPHSVAISPRQDLDSCIWQTAGPSSVGDLDGVVWFRRTVELTAAQIAQSSILSLGTIDDNDQTYVNGIKVGETNGYNIKRSYVIAPGILKSGRNTIAVRVEDNDGGGFPASPFRTENWKLTTEANKYQPGNP